MKKLFECVGKRTTWPVHDIYCGCQLRDNAPMGFALTLLLASSLLAQDTDHRQTKWANATGLPVQTVHRL